LSGIPGLSAGALGIEHFAGHVRCVGRDKTPCKTAGHVECGDRRPRLAGYVGAALNVRGAHPRAGITRPAHGWLGHALPRRQPEGRVECSAARSAAAGCLDRSALGIALPQCGVLSGFGPLVRSAHIQSGAGGTTRGVAPLSPRSIWQVPPQPSSDRFACVLDGKCPIPSPRPVGRA
jgi:hypothetical protein